MNTCGTCKHWGDSKDRDETFKRCLAVIHDKRDVTDSYRDLDADWLNDEERAELRAIRAHSAVVKDGSGYFAALKTREDFGCVLHETTEGAK